MAAYLKTLYLSEPDFRSPPLRDHNGNPVHILDLAGHSDIVLATSASGPCTLAVSLNKGRDGVYAVRFSIYDESFILHERKECSLEKMLEALSGEKAMVTVFLISCIGQWFKSPPADFFMTLSKALKLALQDVKTGDETKTQQKPADPLPGATKAVKHRPVLERVPA